MVHDHHLSPTVPEEWWATCEHLGPSLITAHPDEVLTLFLALVKLTGGPDFEALA